MSFRSVEHQTPITDKNHKKHLSDIFKVINESGVKYDVIHFGACRVNREEK
uniref:putative adhesin n=1 Tax=Shigella sp. FC1139 TaxID=1892899 RepID=UPI00321FED02